MRTRRRPLGPLAIALSIVAATWTGTSPAHADATSAQVGDALDAMYFVDATFNGSDGAGIEVLDQALGGFPTRGMRYLAISTGRAADAPRPNDEPHWSTQLGGLDNSHGHDQVQVDLRLFPPADATCLMFDFRFFSEEYPEFVGSQYNDAFTAETVETGLTITNNQVTSPFNFAFDDAAEPISINTTFGTTSGGTGTTYDGATPLLTAVSPVEHSTDGYVHVWLTIQDLGDSIYDSTVFVDNLRWQTGGTCTRGAAFQDLDGDALPDDWETTGVDFDSNGTIDLDLAAMGARPDHKDVFIELDYMVEEPVCTMTCTTGHSHKPKLDALTKVVDAFRNAPVANPDGTTGINAHIDGGADTVMNPVTGELWGTRTRATQLAHVDTLGTAPGGGYDWTAFDAIKTASFPLERRDVFHYGLFAHNYCCTSSSGLSRGILAGDFIVSLGSWAGSVGTTNDQAGTLLHEFGHNLDLHHGGGDGDNFKPNYLSVMSYAFQVVGLIKDGASGHMDFSRAELDALDENALNEGTGLTPAASIPGLGTSWACAGGPRQEVVDATAPINWDCDTSPGEASVMADVNGDSVFSTLRGYDDWANIRFDGGGVGQLGEEADLPMTTPLFEASKEELHDAGALDAPYQVSITGPGDVRVVPGTGSHSLVYTVTNDGDVADTYSVTATAGPNADLSGVPAVVTLTPGQSRRIEVPVELPDAAATETVRVVVTSVTQAASSDESLSVVRALVVDAAVAEALVESLVDGLTALKASNALYARDADQAIAQLRLALDALPGDVPSALHRLRKAITSLEQLRRTAAPADATTADRVAGAVTTLGVLGRALAEAEIDAAAAAGATAAELQPAHDEVASGDRHRAAGRMEAALNDYREAAVIAVAAKS